MLRSDRMAFCELFMQPEAAFTIMSRLGDMGRVEFLDMNSNTAPFLKNYITEVCRCAKIETRLRYIEHEIANDNMEIPEPSVEPDALHVNEMAECENTVVKWKHDILEMSANQSNLKQDLLEMKEMRYVLNNIGPMLGTAEIGLDKILAKYKYEESYQGGRLYVMAGVVNRTKSYPFQVMLWRVSRGNIYYRQANADEVLEDPYTGREIRKVAFLAFCQGEMLAARMQKIFTGFQVNIYPCPDSNEERKEVMLKVEDRIGDLQEVLQKAQFFRCKSLRLISKRWKSVMIQVRKAKAIYHHLNLFTLDITKNCLIGQCWMSEKDLKIIQDLLRDVSEKMESNVESFLSVIQTKDEPPTIHRTNKFTYAFQVLINAYGDSKYGEVNPGIFTVVSFPFLFAIMFGDCGHALIMLCFAFWMLLNEKKFLKQSGSEIWNIFFGGRYVILMLGMFSFYTGFVYNDIFSLAMNFGESMWANTYDSSYLAEQHLIDLDYKNRLRKPYVFGMDPIWAISRNKIMLQNSLKMKMSLVIGIFHMLFGIVVSILNHIHFKTYYLIFLQFIPEFMFLSCIFLWLVFMIFYKWIYFYNGHDDTQYGCSCAPQILLLFIDMVLYSSTEKKPPEEGCELFLFDSQQLVQAILVTIALVMVPILLFGTPFYLTYYNYKMKKRILNDIGKFRTYLPRDSQEERLLVKVAEYDTPFGEIMIHQAVHTIEFVLSTISHTASYLRLWALSLAHAQLSEMLWVMVLSKLGLLDHSFMGILKLFIAFPVWASFTVAIMVVMEGLSAFLHTLRLHWVEFMSKFFIGGGHAFKPFYFKDILSVEVKSEGVCSAKRKLRQKLTMNNVQLSNV